MALRGKNLRKTKASGGKVGKKDFKGPKHPLQRPWSKSGRHNRKLQSYRQKLKKPVRRLTNEEFMELQAKLKSASASKAKIAQAQARISKWQEMAVPLSDPALVKRYEKSVAEWHRNGAFPSTCNIQAFMFTFSRAYPGLHDRYLKFRTLTGATSLADFKAWLAEQKPE
ncbi:MAG: hypothetical protein V1493_05030 [Candidatus Diapherotrites archaeon]